MTDYQTKDSGERSTYDSGMKRDTDKGKARFDLLLPLNVPYAKQFLTRIAELMERGARKYDPRNWEKANSVEEMERMKSSAFRHFMQWMAGETDEDHAAATFFNMLAHETTAYKVKQKGQSLTTTIHIPNVELDAESLETLLGPLSASPRFMTFTAKAADVFKPFEQSPADLKPHIEAADKAVKDILDLSAIQGKAEAIRGVALETYCVLDGEGDWWCFNGKRDEWFMLRDPEYTTDADGFDGGLGEIARDYGINDLEKQVPEERENPKLDALMTEPPVWAEEKRDFQAGDTLEFLSQDFPFHGMTPGATYEVLSTSRDAAFVTVANDDNKQVRIWAERFRLHTPSDQKES